MKRSCIEEFADSDQITEPPGASMELAGEPKAIPSAKQRAREEGIHVGLDGDTFGIGLPSEIGSQKRGTHDNVVHGGEGIADGVWESVIKKISLLVTFQSAKGQDDNSGNCPGSRSDGGAAGE
jgi:hypothetical protein